MWGFFKLNEWSVSLFESFCCKTAEIGYTSVLILCKKTLLWWCKNRSRLIKDVYDVIELHFLWQGFYFKHSPRMLFLAHLLFVNETSESSVIIHWGLWLVNCLWLHWFFWTWGIDCCSSLCLVHSSKGPAVNVMSPKPLFTKQRQAACSRWDITEGCKHCIQVISTSTVITVCWRSEPW